MLTYVRLDGMSLDIFLLGILRAGPVHGYELKRRVQRPTLTPLSNNSLYPALRRFELAGAVTRSVETGEGRPARNVFALTDDGRELFRSMIATLPAEIAGKDEEFMARVAFFAELSPSERLAVLAARDGALAAQVSQVEGLVTQMNDPSPGAWRTEATRHLLDRLCRERRWVAEMAERAHDDDTTQELG
jgi:DNA-binding PadR family transcriptional regulator